MSRVMFALVTLFVDEKDFVVKFNIFTFIIYVEAVKDSI